MIWCWTAWTRSSTGRSASSWPAPDNAEQVAQSAREVATGERPGHVQILDLGVSDSHHVPDHQPHVRAPTSWTSWLPPTRPTSNRSSRTPWAVRFSARPGPTSPRPMTDCTTKKRSTPVHQLRRDNQPAGQDRRQASAPDVPPGGSAARRAGAPAVGPVGWHCRVRSRGRWCSRGCGGGCREGTGRAAKADSGPLHRSGRPRHPQRQRTAGHGTAAGRSAAQRPGTNGRSGSAVQPHGGERHRVRRTPGPGDSKSVPVVRG